MKKILIAFDGTNFSEAAFEFVRQLNDLNAVLVTGIFVPQLDYANLWSYASTTTAGAVYVPLIEEEENEDVLKNIERFEALCQKNGIAYRVHKDFYDFALPELKRESEFADVMVISGELFYKQFSKTEKFTYLREVLHHASCPVLIVPEDYAFPDNNILAYDGSEASVYAIKQFAYIFPELANHKTLLVYANEDKDKDFPAKELVVELATQHFKDLTFYKVQLDPKKYFSAWIADKRGSILVSGSFSRSGISEAFKKSFVVDIIRDHQVPVFIAHR